MCVCQCIYVRVYVSVCMSPRDSKTIDAMSSLTLTHLHLAYLTDVGFLTSFVRLKCKYVCECVSMCVREREIEREIESVCVFACV